MREDLRLAIRSLRKSPAFTSLAVGILALGVGSGTAVFSIVDAVVLRGLPFDEHDRIVAVLEHDTRRPATFGGGTTTPQMYLDWRRLSASFEAVAGISSALFYVQNERGEADIATAQRVTPEFFEVLRTAPMLGRRFTPNDEVDGQHRRVILSHGFWQRRFGGSLEAIGQTLALRPAGAAPEEAWEIVGVMPPGFSYPVAPVRPTDFYVPQSLRNQDRVRNNSRNYGWLAIARLKDGITVGQAHDDMNRLMAALDAEYPQWSPGRRARVVTLHEHLVGRVRSWMLILLAAVGLVLLIACANVANLMLARGLNRSHEIGIKAALGASRARLTRALLVEGLMLALAGAAVGVSLALAGTAVAKAWLPADVPRLAEISIDLRVLGAAMGAALLTGTIFGLVPALHHVRPDIASALNDSGRSATTAVTGWRLRNGLVVGEVAFSVVLLVAAGLFIASFRRVMDVDVGFDYSNVLTVDASAYPAASGATPEQRRLGLQRILEAIGRIDGVEMAGAVSGGLPLTGNRSRTWVTLPGRGELKDENDLLDRRTVTTGYLRTLGIPLIRGRYLSDEDHGGNPMVVVINEAAAGRYWPGQDALGQRVTVDGVSRAVVGIVGDIRHLGPEVAVRPEAYIATQQDRLDPKFLGTGNVPGTLVMRTTRDPLSMLAAVKSAIWSINPQQRFASEIVTLEGYMDRLIAQRRFNMALLSLFGVLGLAMAAAGIYGVMAYIVAQRTGEIGIRMALGGTSAQMLGMVLRQASRLLGAGLLIGAVGAWYLATLAESFLFEIDTRDPLVFAAALLTLTLAGLLASAVPARRASAVDPLTALGAQGH
jgi:predicted permease